MRYDQYDPSIQKIEVLRLEKRLDDKLYYLRDALPEYSTFPFDMEPETLPEDAPVPINPIKVKLICVYCTTHALLYVYIILLLSLI